MYKVKRKSLSLILCQQEKRKKNERGNGNFAPSAYCYITGLSACKKFA